MPAAASSTASDSDRIGPAHGPIRTCVGCRKRAAAAELLRVAVAPDANGQVLETAPRSRGAEESPGAVLIAADPRRRIPGRGAWLHPDPECVGLAERRRAVPRALRVPGPIDLAPVYEYLAQAGVGIPTASGTPQETKSYGKSMKRQS